MPQPPVQDTSTAPTEEQVKAANEAEFKKWEGDFKPEDLAVPYSREESEKPEGAAETAKDDKTDATEEAAELETYTEPAPIVTVDNPGEYKPADYSFEVTLKDGKSHKISTPDEADKLAEDPDNFETPKQLLDFIRRSQKMENQLDKDKEKWDSQKKTFDEQSETAKQRQDTVENMASEFNYLVGKQLMPEIDKKYLDADWSDPEIAKQPGVKEQIELLNYMVKENETRVKAKVKPLTSIVDAFNAWQQDSGRKKDEADTVAAGEARRAAGARVAGVSASNQAPYVPKGIAVGNPNVFKRNQAVWND